jgi:muconate cycloisomerase
MCHLAAACANVPVTRFPVDILGPLYYAVKPKAKPIRFEQGRVHVPSGDGLGVEITPDELRALAQNAR